MAREVKIGQQQAPTLTPATLKPKRAPKAGTGQAPKVKATHQIDAYGWAESGRWVTVKSSNVAGIAYRLSEKRLFVEFKDGSVYAYENVAESVAKGMFSAGSMGKYVWSHLRDRYSYHKVHG